MFSKWNGGVFEFCSQWWAMAETSEAAASASAPGGDANGEDDKRDERMLECNICLDTARDAVVSMCGHLFWWGLRLRNSLLHNGTDLLLLK